MGRVWFSVFLGVSHPPETLHCRRRLIWISRLPGLGVAWLELLEPIGLGAPCFRDLIQPGVLQEPAEQPDPPRGSTGMALQKPGDDRAGIADAD